MNRREFSIGMVATALAAVTAKIPVRDPDEILHELPEQYDAEWWFTELKIAMEESFGIVLKPAMPEWTLCEAMAAINASSYKVQNELIRSFLRTEEVFK